MASSGSSKKRGRQDDTVDPNPASKLKTLEGSKTGTTGGDGGSGEGAPALAEVETVAEAGAGSGSRPRALPDLLVPPPVKAGHWFTAVDRMEPGNSDEYLKQFVSVRLSDAATKQLQEDAKKAAVSLCKPGDYRAPSSSDVMKTSQIGSASWLAMMHLLGRLVLLPYTDSTKDAKSEKYDYIGIYAAVVSKSFKASDFGPFKLPRADQVVWTNWNNRLSVGDNIKNSKRLNMPSLVVSVLDVKAFPEVPILNDKASADRKKYAPKNAQDLKQDVFLGDLEFNPTERTAFCSRIPAAVMAFMLNVYWRQLFMGPCEKLLGYFFGVRNRTSKYYSTSGEEPAYSMNFLARCVQQFMEIPLRKVDQEPKPVLVYSADMEPEDRVRCALSPFPVFGNTENMNKCREHGYARDEEQVKSVIVGNGDPDQASDVFYEHFKSFPANPNLEDLLVLACGIQASMTWTLSSKFSLPVYKEDKKTPWRERRFEGLEKKYEETKAQLEETPGNEDMQQCLWSPKDGVYFKVSKKVLVGCKETPSSLEEHKVECIRAVFGGGYTNFESARTWARANLPRQVECVQMAENWFNDVLWPCISSKFKEGVYLRPMPLKFMCIQAKERRSPEYVNRTGFLSCIPVGSLVEVAFDWDVYKTEKGIGIKLGLWKICAVAFSKSGFVAIPGQENEGEVPLYSLTDLAAGDEELPDPVASASTELALVGYVPPVSSGFTPGAEPTEGGPAGAGGPMTLPEEVDEDGRTSGFVQ
jgi:hypothetical protein